MRGGISCVTGYSAYRDGDLAGRVVLVVVLVVVVLVIIIVVWIVRLLRDAIERLFKLLQFLLRLLLVAIGGSAIGSGIGSGSLLLRGKRSRIGSDPLRLGNSRLLLELLLPDLLLLLLHEIGDSERDDRLDVVVSVFRGIVHVHDRATEDPFRPHVQRAL